MTYWRLSGDIVWNWLRGKQKGKGKYKEGGVSIFKLSRKSNNRQIINLLSKNFFLFKRDEKDEKKKQIALFVPGCVSSVWLCWSTRWPS
jgi:hypothetical protein